MSAAALPDGRGEDYSLARFCYLAVACQPHEKDASARAEWQGHCLALPFLKPCASQHAGPSRLCRRHEDDTASQMSGTKAAWPLRAAVGPGTAAAGPAATAGSPKDKA